MFSMVKRMVPASLHPVERAKRTVRRRSGDRVMAGPFKGQITISSPDDFIDYTMMLGSYEIEIQPIVESFCQTGFDKVVNVGAAQGYYAVGFASRIPDCKVDAYEADASGLANLRRIVSVNGVADRVSVMGVCGIDELRQSLDVAGRKLIFMDIEGGERDLLDPDQIPALTKCEMLIEEHSYMIAGIDELLMSRFSATHEIERIFTRPRTVEDSAIRPSLMSWHMIRVMDEGRGGLMSWFHMKPKQLG